MDVLIAVRNVRDRKRYTSTMCVARNERCTYAALKLHCVEFTAAQNPQQYRYSSFINLWGGSGFSRNPFIAAKGQYKHSPDRNVNHSALLLLSFPTMRTNVNASS
jgi:hypothetical protein